MEEPPLHHILIAVQRPIVGVVGMGCNEYVVRPRYGPHRYNHRCVGEHASTGLKSELDKIAGPQKVHVHLDAHRAVRGLGPGHKVPKKLHPRPGGRTVIGINVIPAEFRGEIHDASARIQALGREIGTVAADLAEIIEGRIAGVGPFVGVGHRRPAVVWEQLNHAASPPFPIFYARRHFVDTSRRNFPRFCQF